MISKILSKIYSRISWELGYIVIAKKRTPIQTLSDDPREVSYLKKMGYSLSSLPTELGVGLRFYPLTGKTYHPYILALKKIDNSQSLEESAYEILKMYSRLVIHKNANDFIGSTGKENVFPSESHPFGYTYPWSTILPDEMKKTHIGYNRQENKRFGYDSDEYLENIFVSETKIKIETLRLINLRSSIENNGYKDKNDDVLGCFVLIKEGKWKWYVEGGQHRASVMAVLGFEKIPVYVRQIIRREESNIWPSVLTGIYTEKSALELFDRMFNLEPPPAAKSWVDFIDRDLSKKTDYIKI